MRKNVILFMVCFALFSAAVYPEVLSTFPDMAKPTELRMDDNYFYISDQHSVFVYDRHTFKLVKKLCDKGEGPLEFKTQPKITFTTDNIILCDLYKLIIFSKDFKPIKEMRLPATSNRVNPIGENFVLSIEKTIDNNQYRAFTLYDREMKKMKDLVLEPKNEDVYKFLITPWSECRSWKNRVFIAQSHKGFYIDVFNEYGTARNYIISKKKWNR